MRVAAKHIGHTKLEKHEIDLCLFPALLAPVVAIPCVVPVSLRLQPRSAFPWPALRPPACSMGVLIAHRVELRPPIDG